MLFLNKNKINRNLFSFNKYNYKLISTITDRELRRFRILQQSQNLIKDRSFEKKTVNKNLDIRKKDTYMIYVFTGAISPFQRRQLRDLQSIFSINQLVKSEFVSIEKIVFNRNKVSLVNKRAILSNFREFRSILKGSRVKIKINFIINKKTNKNQEYIDLQRKTFFTKLNNLKDNSFIPIRVFFPTYVGTKIPLRRNQVADYFKQKQITNQRAFLPQRHVTNSLSFVRNLK